MYDKPEVKDYLNVIATHHAVQALHNAGFLVYEARNLLGAPVDVPGLEVAIDEGNTRAADELKRMASPMMIDPPSPFDTLETWQDFLRELEQLRKESAGSEALIEAEITKAKKVIERLEREKVERPEAAAARARQRKT